MITLTHSDIAQFLRCRRAWLWGYVNDYSPPEKYTGPLALGSRVHLCLEAMYRDGADPTIVHEELARRDLAHLQESGAPDWDLEKMYEDMVVGRNCITAYCDWLEEEGADHGLVTDAVEHLVEVPILGGKVMLRGKVDVRFRREDDNALLIEDFKGLALDTLLPTPTGFTTMRDVVVGDQLLGSDGLPCTVTGVSDIKHVDCYRIVFEGGESVVADGEHRWMVTGGEVITTAELAARRSAGPVSVPMAKPLELPEHDLGIDPWLLGYWLGDGARGTSAVSCHRDEAAIIAECEALAAAMDVQVYSYQDPRSACLSLRFTQGPGVTSPNPMKEALRGVGVLDDKSVPPILTRLSFEQRLLLLQGIMDADGTWNTARSKPVHLTTREDHAAFVCELASTLGLKARTSTHQHKTNNWGYSPFVYMTEFAPTTVNPFRLVDRKRDQAEAWRCQTHDKRSVTSHERRRVRSVTRVPTVATKCVMVDSADHTYLVGRSMIVTHNTSAMADYRERLERSYQHRVYIMIIRRLVELGAIEAPYVAGAGYRVIRKVRKRSAATKPLIDRFMVPGVLAARRMDEMHIEGICAEIVRVLSELGTTASDSIAYPTPEEHCRWCSYNKPCMVYDGDPRSGEAMLNDLYRRGRHARYDSVPTVYEDSDQVVDTATPQLPLGTT